MAFIFAGSTDLLAARHTSRIIGPLLRWFNPAVTEETIRRVQAVVRKTGHISEYAVLALLIRRARWNNGDMGDFRWRGDEFVSCALLAALYAFSDEFHQSFVPTRDGLFTDVLFDTSGAALGLLLAAAWWQWRKNRIARRRCSATP